MLKHTHIDLELSFTSLRYRLANITRFSAPRRIGVSSRRSETAATGVKESFAGPLRRRSRQFSFHISRSAYFRRSMKRSLALSLMHNRSLVTFNRRSPLISIASFATSFHVKVSTKWLPITRLQVVGALCSPIADLTMTLHFCNCRSTPARTRTRASRTSRGT